MATPDGAPRPDDDADADQSPAVSTGAEALDEDRLDRDPWDVAIDPPAGWQESDRVGITGPEQRDGQSLDERLAQEEPDQAASGRAGTPQPEEGPADAEP